MTIPGSAFYCKNKVFSDISATFKRWRKICPGFTGQVLLYTIGPGTRQQIAGVRIYTGSKALIDFRNSYILM